MLNFNNRVAIVTGAGRGLGRDYALTLASRGARVVVNDVTKPDADEVVRLIEAAGGKAVADYHDVVTGGPAITEAAIKAFGQLDILINNASIVRFGNFAEQNSAEWWRVFDIHFRGTVELCRAAWPHLTRAPHACIINIASSAMLSEPGVSSYSAAKGAIWGFSNTLADEGARVGIRVHTIMPIAWTPGVEISEWDPRIEATMRKEFTPQRVADFVVWLTHQDTPATADTKTFRVNAGRAGRMAMAALPDVHPAADGPEGWAAVAGQILQDRDQLRHFWNEGAMVTHELLSADPSLEPVLKGGSPTSGAGDIADRAPS